TTGPGQGGQILACGGVCLRSVRALRLDERNKLRAGYLFDKQLSLPCQRAQMRRVGAATDCSRRCKDADPGRREVTYGLHRSMGGGRDDPEDGQRMKALSHGGQGGRRRDVTGHDDGSTTLL